MPGSAGPRRSTPPHVPIARIAPQPKPCDGLYRVPTYPRSLKSRSILRVRISRETAFHRNPATCTGRRTTVRDDTPVSPGSGRRGSSRRSCGRGSSRPRRASCRSRRRTGFAVYRPGQTPISSSSAYGRYYACANQMILLSQSTLSAPGWDYRLGTRGVSDRLQAFRIHRWSA